MAFVCSYPGKGLFHMNARAHVHTHTHTTHPSVHASTLTKLHARTRGDAASAGPSLPLAKVWTPRCLQGAWTSPWHLTLQTRPRLTRDEDNSSTRRRSVGAPAGSNCSPWASTTCKDTTGAFFGFGPAWP